ncbi:MAG: methyltransferase domain-containing protein [Bdellovibrionales bacterium]|nr:methyltransferase domain-containing protein [Bdellovibrionales bacterium]
MKLYQYAEKLDVAKYQEIQVDRSESKFSYCRVSILDAFIIRTILFNNGFSNGPFICMGTRNGREMDLFRIALYHPLLSKLIYLFETRKYGFSSLFPWIESWKRSDLEEISSQGVYGVELNPAADRKDTLISSFDDLPDYFTNKFEVVYSNSFDHSLDPEKTAMEWQRIVRPGGFIILHFFEGEVPTYSDPIGDIRRSDLTALFKGEVIHHSKCGNFDPTGTSTGLIIKTEQ